MLKNIINKKIEIEKNNKKNIINKFFKNWTLCININNDNNNKEDEDKKSIDETNNSHSPDIIKGKRQKKKHIKVKFTRALTSKTIISSKKSEDQNISGVHTKKMKIKNIIVNPSEYFRNYSMAIDRSIDLNRINSNDIDLNPNIFKLLKLIDKLETKNIMYKYFISWKKGKK